MTSDIIVTHDTVITTSHFHCHVARCQLNMWQNFNFLKIQKKEKLELIMCHPFNVVTIPLTERV